MSFVKIIYVNVASTKVCFRKNVDNASFCQEKVQRAPGGKEKKQDTGFVLQSTTQVLLAGKIETWI